MQEDNSSTSRAMASKLIHMPSLKNRNCLVTGGTRGIGLAIAKMLVEEGAHVVICGRYPQDVVRVVEELGAGTSAHVKGKAADVSHYNQVVELFEFVRNESGPLDVLVNNAGIGLFASVGDLSVDEWKMTIETNLSGPFYCAKQAAAAFRNESGGHIVNIGSLAGAHAFAGGAAYNASKFGITGFSEAIFQDLRNRNVRVTHVMPGSVATEFGHGNTPQGADWKIQPEDVAEVVRMALRMHMRTVLSRIEMRPSQPKR
jgi:NAD(P)-dependent dehydrogenase (short-subunit alcohol dehydrogenase family)